jgi:lipid II:glycine glycyltransferase (peptidoglycan interpeptide bridge formation enzyme)
MDPSSWNETVTRLPGPHLLQSWEWGQVKRAYGWVPIPKVWTDAAGEPIAAALVLKRSISFLGLSPNLNVLYVPRGPLLDWSNVPLRERILRDLQAMAYQYRGIFIKIDPEVIVGRGLPGTDAAEDDAVGQAVLQTMQSTGWALSGSQVQFKNTVWLDIAQSDQDLLAKMKQKTRYNLRLAERKGVTIRQGSSADFALLYRMYAETSVRDQFVIRSAEYYTHVWSTFFKQKMLKPIIAEFEGQPIAALMLFTFGHRAWYLYGMSTDQHRDKMPNYLLQFEAMRAARDAGCTQYDLWGAPDHFDETDPMWGVYRFKEGLGGQVIRTIGAFDFAAWPGLYSLYTRTLPRILALMRRRRMTATQGEVSL